MEHRAIVPVLCQWLTKWGICLPISSKILYKSTLCFVALRLKYDCRSEGAQNALVVFNNKQNLTGFVRDFDSKGECVDLDMSYTSLFVDLSGLPKETCSSNASSLELIKLEPRSALCCSPIFDETNSVIIGNEEMRKWRDETGATTRPEAYTVKQMTSAITANPVARTFFIYLLL